MFTTDGGAPVEGGAHVTEPPSQNPDQALPVAVEAPAVDFVSPPAFEAGPIMIPGEGPLDMEAAGMAPISTPAPTLEVAPPPLLEMPEPPVVPEAAPPALPAAEVVVDAVSAPTPSAVPEAVVSAPQVAETTPPPVTVKIEHVSKMAKAVKVEIRPITDATEIAKSKDVKELGARLEAALGHKG